MSEWKPIRTAPKDGTKVLVALTHVNPQVTIASWKDIEIESVDDPDEKAWCNERGKIILQPYSWMPLPEAPELDL